MFKKLLVLLALAIAGLVAHDQSSRISEADVRAYYRQQMDALRVFDSATICEAMAEDFRLEDVQHADGAATRMSFDRDAACGQMEESLGLIRTVSEKTGGRVAIEFAYELGKVEISPDGRRASVEATSTARIGGRLLTRGRSTEDLSRSLWRIRSHGGKSQTWTYGG